MQVGKGGLPPAQDPFRLLRYRGSATRCEATALPRRCRRLFDLGCALGSGSALVCRLSQTVNALDLKGQARTKDTAPS